MEAWLEEASKQFPELLDSMTDPNLGIVGLWIELFNMLQRAYDGQTTDDDLIRRIYHFAAWCFQQPQTIEAGTDPSSAAALGLIEDIPLDSRVSSDLYRWMSEDSFRGFENLFRYHLDADQFQNFSKDFFDKKKHYHGVPRL